MILLNPVMGLLHNQATNRWHPAIYTEAPLPGPDSQDKPVRHKSRGHHTDGFETREAALEDMQNTVKKIVDGGHAPSVAVFDQDLEWAGHGLPADVAYFRVEGTVATRRL